LRSTSLQRAGRGNPSRRDFWPGMLLFLSVGLIIGWLLVKMRTNFLDFGGTNF
jgi:hypothetical protein